jgi:hypothetical protein
MEKNNSKPVPFWIKYSIGALGIFVILLAIITSITKGMYVTPDSIFFLSVTVLLGIAAIISNFWHTEKLNFVKRPWFNTLFLQGCFLIMFFLKDGFSFELILMLIIFAGLNYLQYRSESKVITNDKE